MNDLKPKELQIIALTADGMTADEIGPEVKLTPRTVQNYRHELCEKLGAVNMCQAIAIALRQGIIR